MNVVTACRSCNHRKGNRTPEQAHMPLLYAPYVPSLWEDFILRNRRILADQMEFLMAHLPRSVPPARLIDGLETLGRIRRNDSRLPVVLVSGDDLNSKWDFYQRAGASACLLKPMAQEALQQVLSRWSR
jgi:hypothetical protein